MAQDEAKSAGTRSTGQAFGRWLMVGGGSGSIADLVVIPLLLAVGLVGGSIDAASTAHKNAEDRKTAYASAVESCLAPAAMEEQLGPEHPEVARSLEALAERYAAHGHLTQAQPLYARALAIKEKALGPEAPDVATTLERYTAVLRKMDRGAEAEPMEARAEAIRRSQEERQGQPRDLPEPGRGL